MACSSRASSPRLCCCSSTAASAAAFVYQRSLDSLAKKVAAGALAKFSDALSQVLGGGSVPQGSQLSFACKADAMMIAFGESSPSTLKEKGVCVALFSVYYGSPPISPAAKEAAAKAFAELYV